jgi:hypothetical protein
MEHPSEGAVHTEPFAGAEQHRKDNQHEAQTVAAVSGIVLSDTGYRANQRAETSWHTQDGFLPERFLHLCTVLLDRALFRSPFGRGGGSRRRGPALLS